MAERKVFKYPNSPWWWPRSWKFRFIMICLLVWFVLVNLQALKLIATSMEPWILGIPFSLFFTLFVTAIATVLVVSIFWLWSDYVERSDKIAKGEEKGGER